MFELFKIINIRSGKIVIFKNSVANLLLKANLHFSNKNTS